MLVFSLAASPENYWQFSLNIDCLVQTKKTPINGPFHNGQLIVVDKLREMVRLAEGITEQETLLPEVEERAIACLKAGAADWVATHRLAQLAPIAERALADARGTCNAWTSTRKPSRR